MTSELTLVSLREGKVRYQVAHAGDRVAAGTAGATTSGRIAQEPAADVAAESLAQLRDAWAPPAGDCNKLFQRRGSALAFRQPVEFAQGDCPIAAESVCPRGNCRLERASHKGGAIKVTRSATRSQFRMTFTALLITSVGCFSP